MAIKDDKRIDEIYENSSNDKDVARRGGSAIAALIALPAMLGIVRSQNQWIYNGGLQSFREHIAKRLGDLFGAAENNPIVDSISGSKPIQVQVRKFKEELLEKAGNAAGAETFKKSAEIPNWAQSAEELAADREAAFPTKAMADEISAPGDFPSVKNKLDLPILNSQQAYNNMTRNIVGAGSGVPENVFRVNGQMSKADIFKNIDAMLADYSVGLSPAELARAGTNKAVINQKMASLDQKHMAILRAAGHPELFDTTFSSTAYAKQLSSGLDTYRNQIADLKQQVNKLNELATTSSNKKVRTNAKAQLNLLSKNAGLSTTQYVQTINSMSVRVEVSSILRGEVAFPKATVVIDMGKHKSAVKQSFNIERFGMFLPHRGAQVHNSALLVQGTTNAVTSTLAEMQDAFSNVTKQVNDLIDAGLEGYQIEQMSSHTRTVYRELVGPQTGHLQDVIRGFKVINDDFRALSGEKTDFFYKMHALAKQSFFTDSQTYQTETPVIAFDMEFNSPRSGTKGSQMQTRDARTRIFWMNYIVKKGGTDEKIYNHFILPENWEDVRQSARLFTARHQDPSGFVLFEDLVKTFEQAQDDINKGARYVDVPTGGVNSVLSRSKERIWSEWGSMVELARTAYQSPDGTVAWLGHNINQADLPILHKTVSRVLENNKDLLSSDELRMLKRLSFDTSPQSLASKGLIMDTYAMSRAVFHDVERVTSASLENSFEVLVNQAIVEANPEHTPTKGDEWTRGLSDAVRRSKGKINDEVKQILNDLPKDMRLGVKNWILHSPEDVIATFGAQGHHSAPFDTRKALILLDLNRWKMQKIKSQNPELYKTITQLGNTAEQIVSGKRFAWYRNIDLADSSSLFDVPDHGLGEQGPEAYGNKIYSHLFAFTPAAASRGRGGLFGPENYLPFGQYTNLQKQMYQTASSKTLLPGLEQIEIKASKGLFPVVQRGIDSAESMFSTSLFSNISQKFNEFQQSIGKLNAPVANRFQVMTAYLPDHNSMLAQDTALWANESAHQLARHFPKGAEGTHPAVFSKRAQDIISAINTRGSKFSSQQRRNARTFLKNLGIVNRGDNITVREFLEHAGMAPEILDMVDHETISMGRGRKRVRMGDQLLKDVMTMDGDSMIMQLNFQNSYKDRVNTLLGKNRTNVLSPGKALLYQEKFNVGGKNQRSRYDINNPLKYASILDQLTFDYNKGTFIYDITPFETPGFAKIVDSGKIFKGNIHGIANNISFGQGIGLVLASKKPNMASLIDVHMRRSLLAIHKKDMNVISQRSAIKAMLKDAFNISDEEFQAIFKLTEGKPAPGQRFKNPIVMVEMVDNYQLGLGSKDIMNRVFKMLASAGITHEELRKTFIEQNRDILKQYGVNKDIRAELGKVYDRARASQEKVILAMDTGVNVSTSQMHVINEMKRIVRKTDVALFDPIVGVVGDEINVTELQSGKLYDADGRLARGIKVEPFATLIQGEFSVAEDFMDIRDPLKRSVDAHGMPLNKTFSIWQSMIIYNNSRNNEVFQDSFMRHAMSNAGRFDKNVKKFLHVHMEAAAALQDGYKFNSRYKTLSYEEMKKDVRHMSKLDLSKLNLDNMTESKIEQILLSRGSTPEDAAKMAAELSDDISLKLNQAGVVGGLLTEESFNRMNVFRGSSQFDFIKMELLSKENQSMLKNALDALGGTRKDLVSAIDDINLKNRTKLGAEIRNVLLEIAKRDPGEARMLKTMFKQMPGSFIDPLDGILMPHISPTNPIYLAEENKYLLAGSSKYKVRMEEVITEFNDELTKVLDTRRGGITENSINKIKGIYDNLFADLAPNVVAGIYGGISSGAWKANQLYGRGQQYAKAVDSVLLAKQSLGAMVAQYKLGDDSFVRSKGFKSWQNFLDSSIGGKDDPVIKALTGLRDKIGGSQIDKTINDNASKLGLTREQYFRTQEGKHFLKIRNNVKGAKSVIGELIDATAKVTYGDVMAGITTGGDRIGNLSQGGYLRAAGLGVGENFITSSQLAASITSGDPYELMLQLTEPNDAVAHWRKILTGRTHLIDTLARNPMFENKLGYMFANTYVYHDKLFSDMGIKGPELTKIVAINGLELMMMRGDYDGDLVQRTLQTLRPNTLKNKNFNEAIFKERQRIIESMRMRGMEMGKASMEFRGLDYKDLSKLNAGDMGWDHTRHLIGELGNDDAEMILSRQISEIVGGISENHAKETMKKRGLTYMVQQLLTGPIGEQQKMWDMMYNGNTTSLRNDTVEFLRLKLTDPKINDDAVRSLLTDLGYGAASREGADLKSLARDAIKQADDAWHILNQNADVKTFNPITKSFESTKAYRNVDLLTDWVRLFTHEVPIEKAKGAGMLPEIMATVSTKLQFHAGNINESESIRIAEQIYDGLGIKGANFSNLYIDPSSDIFDGSRIGEARMIRDDLKTKFISSVTASMHLNKIHNTLVGSGMKVGNINTALASRNPRGAIYGALIATMGEGSDRWIGNELSEIMSQQDFNMISNVDDFTSIAAHNIEHQMNMPRLAQRTGLETLKKFGRGMMEGLSHSRWTKRAAIGLLAFNIMDPNTNSLLLPDQRGQGEESDIPSLAEISSGYRRREVKVRSTSPALVDRLRQAAGLPTSLGRGGTLNHFVPAPPTNTIRYNRKLRKDGPANMHEFSRQIGGILLR